MLMNAVFFGNKAVVGKYHYSDQDNINNVYHDMHSNEGKSFQIRLVLIMSFTMLSTFGKIKNQSIN